MQIINTSSLTSNVKDWLANTHHPRVLHIFDNACNLINERGEVLSIVTQQIGNGPFNLVVEETIYFSEHLGLESKISVSSTQLRLGALTVHIAYASIWNPRPNWESLRARRSHINQLRITNYWNRSGFNMPLEDHSWQLNHPGLPITQSLVSDFSSALADADVSLARKPTSQLAGLGAGLTPAGDDFIMGAMHAAWIIHPVSVASVLTREIANIAAPLTTSLSAAWLSSAGRGEAGILWHQFFDALAGQVANPTYLQQAIDKILSVGETSGADALAGFFSTMLAWSALPHSK